MNGRTEQRGRFLCVWCLRLGGGCSLFTQDDPDEADLDTSLCVAQCVFVHVSVDES